MRIHDSEQEPLTRGEVERNEDERSLRVEPDEVNGRVPEPNPRVDDPQSGLNTLDVLGDQLLQVADVLDFQLLARRVHCSLLWSCGFRHLTLTPHGWAGASSPALGL